METKKYIFSDEEIRNLTDTTPFSADEPVGFLGGEDGCGFWLAAEEVSKASAAQTAKLTTGQARALFYMRNSYFLGVLQGAEEYRAMLTDDMETENAPFSLDDYASAEFRESLEAMEPEDFRHLCALLGLSVPWKNKRFFSVPRRGR